MEVRWFIYSLSSLRLYSYDDAEVLSVIYIHTHADAVNWLVVDSPQRYKHVSEFHHMFITVVCWGKKMDFYAVMTPGEVF